MNYSKYILIIFFVIHSTYSQDLESFWEENGDDDELAILLEYKYWAQRLLSSNIAGYKLYLEDKYPFSLKPTFEIAPEPFGAFDAASFNFTARNTGESLERQLLRSQLNLGSNTVFEIMSEKDPGEEIGDFVSAYLAYQGGNSRFILGNYSAGFGQGLVMWRGFNWDPYPENPITPFKSHFLRGYSSTMENGSLFGGGALWENGRLSLMGIYSDNRWDASGDEQGVDNVQTSGEHVTDSQKDDQDRLRERIFAAYAQTKFDWGLNIGLSVSSAYYSPPFAPDDSVKRTFEFSGGRNTIWGIDYFLERGSFTAAGEFAKTSFGGTAFISRLKVKFPNVMVQLEFRNLERNFKNLRAIYPQGNECGITFALMLKPWKKAEIAAMSDIWKNPWRTYSYEMPPEGFKNSICFTQSISPYRFSFRLRKTYNSRGGDPLTRNQIRLKGERKFPGMILRCRFEMMEAITEDESATGYMLSNEIKASTTLGNVSLALSYFTIPNYDCRIYQYQDDVPGTFYVPFYYGNGFNVNAVYELSLRSEIFIALKTSITAYTQKPNPPSEPVEKTFAIYFSYRYNRKAD